MSPRRPLGRGAPCARWPRGAAALGLGLGLGSLLHLAALRRVDVVPRGGSGSFLTPETPPRTPPGPPAPPRVAPPRFDRVDAHHGSDQSAACARDVAPALLDEWRRSGETVCANGTLSVRRYAMRRWELEPAFHVYDNVVLRSLLSPGDLAFEGRTPELRPYECGALVRARDEPPGEDGAVVYSPDRTVVRVMSFDPINPYEGFHARVNVAMAMAMFNVTDPQIVYVVNKEMMRVVKGEIPNRTLEAYAPFSSASPVLAYPGGYEGPAERFLVPRMIDVFNSGTSMLVTRTHKSGGELKGRGTDHHCKSTLFRGIVDWMTSSLLGDIGERSLVDDTNKTIEVVWSSRAPFCCVKGQTYAPSRHVEREAELVRRVAAALGGGHNVAIVNFGELSTLESVRIASRSHVIAGAHGAGLVWSAFLPPHGGLVEAFGGDRPAVNRHYHNVASLADVHYRSLKLARGGGTALRWDDRTVDEIASLVRSINFAEEPGR